MRKYAFDAAKTKDEIVKWIQDYFRKNGPEWSVSLAARIPVSWQRCAVKLWVMAA